MYPDNPHIKHAQTNILVKLRFAWAMYSVTCYYIDVSWLEIVCSFYSHIEGVSKIVAFPDIINPSLLRCKLRRPSSLIMVCQGITGNI